jgi:hypothetical protein
MPDLPDAINRSIEFCARFDAEFPSAIAGASRDRIDEIAGLMPRAPSAAYLEFLGRLSEHHGWLDFGTCSTRATDLLGMRGLTLKTLPEGVELLGVDLSELEHDIFLVRNGGEEAEVIRHPVLQYVRTGGYERSKGSDVAGSLAELICLQALNRFYTRRQPLLGTYIETEQAANRLERCRRLGEELRFEAYWFSSRLAWIARRDDLVVVAKQPGQARFTLGLAGSDPKAWAEVGKVLREELELEPLLL